MAFVKRVAEAGEEANHHPDILVPGRNEVRLVLDQPSAAGLTHAVSGGLASSTASSGRWVGCYGSLVAVDERRRPTPK